MPKHSRLEELKKKKPDIEDSINQLIEIRNREYFCNISNTDRKSYEKAEKLFLKKSLTDEQKIEIHLFRIVFYELINSNKESKADWLNSIEDYKSIIELYEKRDRTSKENFYYDNMCSQLARLLIEKHKDFEQVEYYLNKVSSKGKKDFSFLRTNAYLLNIKENTKEAIEFYKKAEKTDCRSKDIEIHKNMADIYIVT